MRLIIAVNMAISSESLLFQRLRKRRCDSALLTEQFKPELAFIGFLECATELGYELIIRSRARCLSNMGGHRGARTQKLFPSTRTSSCTLGSFMKRRIVPAANRLVRSLNSSAFCFLLSAFCFSSLASQYHVAPDGHVSAPGTLREPLSLTRALSAAGPARPGDTIWLHRGTYPGAYTSTLTGQPDKPIIVRQWPGERATS